MIYDCIFFSSPTVFHMIRGHLDTSVSTAMFNPHFAKNGTGKLALPHSLRVRRVCERKYQKKEARLLRVVRDVFVGWFFSRSSVGWREILLKLVGGKHEKVELIKENLTNTTPRNLT